MRQTNKQIIIREILDFFIDFNKNVANKTVQFEHEQLNQILAAIYSPGPSVQVVYDHFARYFCYVGNNSEKIWGSTGDITTAESFLQRVHPDDLNHFLEGQEIAAHFYFNFIEKEKIPNYKHSYQYRFMDRAQKYRLVLHQAIALTYDENFKMSNVLMNLSDISHITTVNNFKSSFIDIRGEQSYFNIGKNDDMKYHLTKAETLSNREREILKCLSEGLSSKEIAQELHIAYDTVRTHRTNILKKTKFKTITQAACHYIKEGWL